MVVGVLRTYVMNTPPRRPKPTNRSLASLVATALLAALVVGPVLAASYPTAAAVAGGTLAVTAAGLVLARRSARRETDAAVCVPKTDACLDV